MARNPVPDGYVRCLICDRETEPYSFLHQHRCPPAALEREQHRQDRERRRSDLIRRGILF